MNKTRVSKRHRPARGPLDPLPCHRVQSDLWFSELPAELEQAKAFCQPGRLRTACLAGALERAEPGGIMHPFIVEQPAAEHVKGLLAAVDERRRGRQGRPVWRSRASRQGTCLT